jgi:hypothetical protein
VHVCEEARVEREEGERASTERGQGCASVGVTRHAEQGLAAARAQPAVHAGVQPPSLRSESLGAHLWPRRLC